MKIVATILFGSIFLLVRIFLRATGSDIDWNELDRMDSKDTKGRV